MQKTNKKSGKTGNLELQTRVQSTEVYRKVTSGCVASWIRRWPSTEHPERSAAQVLPFDFVTWGRGHRGRGPVGKGWL